MAGKQVPDKNLVRKKLPRKGKTNQEEDQIADDIRKAKEVKEQIVQKVQEQLQPVISQAAPKITSAAQPVKSLFGGELIKKILRITTIVILIIIFLYIISLFVKNLKQNGEVALNGLPTPTLAPYLPYNPSVYAEDDLVLKLEEDIKVLDRELSTAQLKETILTPPVLDFDINFED